MILKKCLAASLVVMMGTVTISQTNGRPVRAAQDYEVSVIKAENQVIIGNDYVSRVFSVENNKLKTEKIINKRTDNGDTTFSPAVGSEEFIINTIQNVSPKYPEKGVDRIGWTATSNTANEANQEPQKIIDGNVNTIWHSKGGNFPYEVTIDMKNSQELKAFSYQARQDGPGPAWGINGSVASYEVYLSEDGSNWGNAVKTGQFEYKFYNKPAENKYNLSDPFYVNFDTPRTGRYIKFKSLSSQNGGVFASGAELNFYKENIDDVSEMTKLKSSQLTLRDVITENTPESNGKKVVFDFEPYNFGGAQWNIDMVVVMNNNDHFMRKFLEITMPEADQDKITMDYIDTDHFVLGNDVSMEDTWSRPEGMSSMWITGYDLSLGQPVYINGMFFGSEFPVTDNRIINKDVQFKYFSGKTFDKLDKTTEGKFVTWQNVVGAARSKEESVIQSDFFDYIDTIATETSFRKQYNSWYDHMMNINNENIVGSFYEIEKGLTQYGVEPLDSYVVDDGWNDYTKDFWTFNSKFPNELYDSKELAANLSSHFGLWLGPRGGYNYPGQFGRQMEAAGTGGYNPAGGDVCIAHGTYLEKMKTLFLDYQNRFDISYWKLDGFAFRPCTATNHGHMTGGANGMYYTSELWENWTDIFEVMREERKSKGKDLWINMTCYVNPSPWFLRWVNTVWLQDSGDNGFIDKTRTTKEPLNGTDKDQALTYRDDVYFNIFKTKSLQFPLKNVYNHDPIYGNTATNFIYGGRINMTTDEFRQYLYMLATRGTAFWELYYSYNMMDNEKWMVNAELLKWAEENHHILKNAKIIGKTPAEGNVYGYSSWDGEEGIISIRNPRNVEQSFEVTLDRLIGVKEGTSGLTKSTVLPYTTVVDSKIYNYGEKVTVSLKPHEEVIYQFGKKDATAPKLVSAKNIDSKTIRVEFDERISAASENFTITGNGVKVAELQADYRTLLINLENELSGSSFALNISNIKDLSGNNFSGTLTMNNYINYVISKVESRNDLKNAQGLPQENNTLMNTKVLKLSNNSYDFADGKSVEGTADFSVSMLIRTASKNTQVLSQKDGYSLSINDTGKLVFDVKGLRVESKASINDNSWKYITAVKEKNGMIKIYINGELIASKYDENNSNPELIANTVTVGSNNFIGDIANIIVSNKGYSFDEVAENAKQYPMGDYEILQTSMVVIRGDLPSLPKKVTVKYVNGYTAEADVIWDSIDADDFNKIGKIQVQGAIEGLVKKAIANIEVTAGIFNDEFTSQELNLSWAVQREVKNNWSLTKNPGYLQITGTEGYNDNSANYNDNIFLQSPAAEDYVITTKLTGKPTNAYQSAGLLAYKDSDNYVRMARKNVGRNILSFTVEVLGNATHVEIDDTISSADLYLALEKVGNRYTAYYSEDGTVWKTIKSGSNESTATVNFSQSKVGLYATNGTGPVYTANFDYFRYMQNSPATTIISVEPVILSIPVNGTLPSVIKTKAVLSNSEIKEMYVNLVDFDENLLTKVGTYEVNGVISGTTKLLPVKINVLPSDGATKEELYRIILIAQSKYNSSEIGDKPGQYPRTAKYALLAAINVAKAVNNNGASTQANVEAAIRALNNAIKTFEGRIITG